MQTNQTICITGASSGIGYALARKFHSAGWRVVVTARREDRLRSLVAELEALRTGSAAMMVADLSLDDGIQRVSEWIRQEAPSMLINNAGVGRLGAFGDAGYETERQIIAVNAFAPLALSCAVIPAMKERGSGWIVNVASVVALQPTPYLSSYAAAKSLLLHHSLALAEELKGNGISVLTVCPGPVRTEFHSRLGASSVQSRIAANPEAIADAIMKALQGHSRLLYPGLLAWLYALPLRLLPRSLYARLMGQRMRRCLKQ